jgi:flagellar motor switch protein FliN/FliY
MEKTGLITRTDSTMTADQEIPETAPATSWMRHIEEHPSWSVVSRLPVTIEAAIFLSRFRVRDLLGLAEGQVFESALPDTEDVPLKVGIVQLGWTEFEVVEQKIAVRLTRLA